MFLKCPKWCKLASLNICPLAKREPEFLLLKSLLICYKLQVVEQLLATGGHLRCLMSSFPLCAWELVLKLKQAKTVHRTWFDKCDTDLFKLQVTSSIATSFRCPWLQARWVACLWHCAGHSIQQVLIICCISQNQRPMGSAVFGIRF